MESTELAKVHDAEIVPTDDGLTMVVGPEEARKRLLQLQKFIGSVMKKGEDFGQIPGVNKPSLFKAGAEKLSEIYGLVPNYVVDVATEDWAGPFFFYRIRCQLTRGGRAVSEGLGSCNSREDKYAWRWVGEKYVPPGIDRTSLRSKRGKFGMTYRLPNDDVCSTANTILKMAKKRAFIDAVITATRSSGIFTQDVEDMPREETPEEPIDDQLQASIVAEQDKLCAELRGDLERADSEEKAFAVGQLIAQAHTQKRISDGHRAQLRRTFAEVSKRLAPKETDAAGAH